MFLLWTLLSTGRSTQWTDNASTLRRHILFVTSIFHYMEIKQSTCLGRNNGCTSAGDKFCLCVIGCCGEQSGCSAFERLVCVIRGLWFGTGPECHDVYSKLKSCGFPLLHIISSVSWRWLPNQARTTRVPERKVPTFSLHFIQGSVCQIRKQLSCVFSECWKRA